MKLFLKFAVLLLGVFFTCASRDSNSTIVIQLSLPHVSYSTTTFSGSEINCLSQVVWSEARGEPLEGQLAVAIVAMNRTVSGRFNPKGRSLCSVVHEKNQFAYSAKHNVTSDMIAQLATDSYGLVPDTPRHWYFFNRGSKGEKIGNHRFYT